MNTLNSSQIDVKMREPSPSFLAGLSALTKPNLTGLVIFSTGIGFVLADKDFSLLLRAGGEGLIVLVAAMVCTTLLAASSSVINQMMEAKHDINMERTKHRPIATGQFSMTLATVFAIGFAVAGSVLLAFFTNYLALSLAVVSLLLYVCIYTPLKRRSTANTLVGAIPGAIPTMVGWAAVTGNLEAGAWVLGGIVFVWQIPHFLAIAWMYRQDYAKAGFKMLPITDPSGLSCGRLMFIYAALLIPVSLVAPFVHVSGYLYLVCAMGLGIYFTLACYRFAKEPSDLNAKNAFHASIIYLSALFAIMLLDPTVVGTAFLDTHGLK